MINEKELRIGNQYSTIRNYEIVVKGFDTLNKFIIIDPIYLDPEISTGSEDSVIFEDLNPIELSEQKLLQMGFMKEKVIFINVSSDKGAKLRWDESKSHLVLEDCEEGVIGQPLRYVHQLQNIYYLLTGKELPLTAATV
jgi:hypothetical protein